MSEPITEQQIHDVLMSTECACGKAKPCGFAICGTCSFELPREMRDLVWDLDDPDYPQRYAEVLDVLRKKGDVA
jgi:hypothetical protein